MNGVIAQAVALTCHGNARLAGLEIPTFFPGNSTCQFCEYVRFGRGGWRGGEFATPDEWFASLVRQKARGLRLLWLPDQRRRFPDRMLAGLVGGGGGWVIEAAGRHGAEYRCGRWQVGNQEAPDRRIWRVTYTRTTGQASTTPAPDLPAVKGRLVDSLRAISRFAGEHDVTGYVDQFDRAVAQLDTVEPLAGVYHLDLAPPGLLTEQAQPFLYACQLAWVFGAMGSWNDLGLDDDQEYSSVSERLFTTVIEAICAVANSSWPAEVLDP